MPGRFILTSLYFTRATGILCFSGCPRNWLPSRVGIPQEVTPTEAGKTGWGQRPNAGHSRYHNSPLPCLCHCYPCALAWAASLACVVLFACITKICPDSVCRSTTHRKWVFQQPLSMFEYTKNRRRKATQSHSPFFWISHPLNKPFPLSLPAFEVLSFY